MGRFTMVLAAAVATAMLVIAVSTLDAVGADPPAKASNAPDDLVVRLADCLRSRGVAVPALGATALDRWLQTHSVPDAEGRACKRAVAPRVEMREAPSADAAKLSQCLRAKGLDAPSDPMALKQWIGAQHATAALRAIKECGVVDAPGPAPCGGAAKPAPPDKAARPEADSAEPVM